MKAQIDMVTQGVESMINGFAKQIGAVRHFIPLVVSLHARAEHPLMARYQRETLAVCRRLIPVGRELQSALGELVSAIEGTWKPPLN